MAQQQHIADYYAILGVGDTLKRKQHENDGEESFCREVVDLELVRGPAATSVRRDKNDNNEGVNSGSSSPLGGEEPHKPSHDDNDDIVRMTIPTTSMGWNANESSVVWKHNMSWNADLGGGLTRQIHALYQDTTTTSDGSRGTAASNVTAASTTHNNKTTTHSSSNPSSHHNNLRRKVENRIKGFLSFSTDESNDDDTAAVGVVPQEPSLSSSPSYYYYLKMIRRGSVMNRNVAIASIRLFFVVMDDGLSFHGDHGDKNNNNNKNMGRSRKHQKLCDLLPTLPESYTAWIVPNDAIYVRQDTVILPATLETRLPNLVVTEHCSGHEHSSYIPILAVRYQRVDERYHDDPAIIDVAVSFYDCHQRPVIPQGDFDDDHDNNECCYCAPWEMCNDGSKPLATGTPMALVRRNAPQGLADTPFSTSVIGRFPFVNYKHLPLPEEELPMFCYPTGCRLHRTALCESPLPQYYGFCVKNERGDSIYVSCVSFMEPLTSDKQCQLDALSEQLQHTSLVHARFCQQQQQRNGETAASAVTTSVLTAFDDMTTFENKTICLVSRYPFWSAFRKLLAHLHTLVGTRTDVPLERWISHLLLTVPLPNPGGPAICIPTLLANVTCSLPPEKDFPLMDLPYSYLFSCLEIKTVVTIVLGLLALERKVICISQRPSLVLDVCELLRSLLFPFELCAPYVPRLTEPFKSSLNFPGAIFVGIHDDGEAHGLGTMVKKSYPEESIVIDLDTGVMDCYGDRYDVLSAVWDLIPHKSRDGLVSELEMLCRDAKIVDGQEPLDSLADEAFLVDLADAVDGYDINLENREPLDDRAVRDAFLRFFCSVLGGYERFLVVPDADFLVSGNEWFDAKGFLASVPAGRASYLGALVSTQLFQSFIQKRTEASDIHCMLFDECLVEYHSTTVPYGRLGGDLEEVKPPGTNGPKRMLYSLLVDQAAKLPAMSEHGSVAPNRSMDSSDAENSLSFSFSKASVSGTDSFAKFPESPTDTTVVVSVPSRQDLPPDRQYTYFVDGNPCFPHVLNEDLLLPKEPSSQEVEFSRNTSIPLTRSERELEEANRRGRIATAHGGMHNQRRCLWQLPKLMGSHFLGAWLLCIPSLVSQPHLSEDQQARHLLRALGALRLLRSRQRIVPDEAAYRALMVACGRSRSDRRVELVKLFGLLRSDSIFPNAVTLGQYTKALAEGYSKRSSSEGEFGVEVSASGSKIGMGIEEQSVDLTTRLHNLDSSLSELEGHGKRWRQKYADGDERGRRSSKSWFPVNVSSSFVPSGTDNTDLHLIAIWSRTCICQHCGYIPLEEEIQAGWDLTVPDDGRPAHSVSCPRCESFLVPMLGYRDMSLHEALALSEPGPGLPPQLQTTIDNLSSTNNNTNSNNNAGVFYVTYMNPSALRLALERYLEEFGEDVLERDTLRRLDPEIYFNFWWYCARFSLPLPLGISANHNDVDRRHGHHHAILCAAWDRTAAERGCWSAAKVLYPVMWNHHQQQQQQQQLNPLEAPQFGSLPHPLSDASSAVTYSEMYDEIPLLSRYNLQGFYASVWDDPKLSQVLVALVEACDKRDFRPVVQQQQQQQQNHHHHNHQIHNKATNNNNNNTNNNSSYIVYLYLAKYQCTSAFHTFFPTVLKPCKGYHYWCAMGAPLPMFDRLLREADPTIGISERALGFRCVFGHLI